MARCHCEIFTFMAISRVKTSVKTLLHQFRILLSVDQGGMVGLSIARNNN